MESVNQPKVARGLAVPAVKLDQAGLIAEDLHCRRCGYNLRTMSPEVQCPECGTAVGQSIHGDYLQYADPAWVRGLATGATVVFVATTLQTVCWAVIVGLVLNRYPVPGWYWMSTIVTSTIVGVGSWLITVPDPGSGGLDARARTRKRARLFLVVGFVLMASGQFFGGLAAGLRHALDILAHLNLIAGVIALLSCVKGLLLRIPDRVLARSLGIFAWYFVASLILNATMGLARIVVAGNASPAANIVPLAGCFSGFASIVAMIWAIRIAFRIRLAFNEAAWLSQATNDAHNSPQLDTKGGVP